MLKLKQGLNIILRPAPLNEPIYVQLRRQSKNPLLYFTRMLLARATGAGIEILTNERIVEIPFVYQNFALPKKSRVLDFGCNESKVSIELASLGYEVTGVDINDYPFTHPNFRFIKGNFLENTFPSNYFDAVVAISAVEHCGLSAYGSPEFENGDRRVIEEMYRVLNDNGHLFLTVPFGKKGLITGQVGQRIYDVESLSALLGGFNIVREEYFIGADRRYWLPCPKERLADVDSAAKGYTAGVVCVHAQKER